MKATERPPLGRASAREPLDPTGMMLGAVPVSAADRWRRRIAIGVSLLWLLFPVFDLAGSNPTPLRAACIGVTVLLFVALYARLPRERSPGARAAVPSLVAMTLISAVLTLVDRPSWSGLFIFTAIFGVTRLPQSAGALWIVLCAALTAATNVAGGSGAVATISLTATTLAVGFMMLAFRRLLDLNAELVTAREEVRRLAVTEERLRFARDLHDLLGQSLTVIAVKAELAERLLRRNAPAAVEHVTDIKTVARDALKEVRDTVGGYRQPTLADELSGARIALRAAGITAELSGGDAEPMDPTVEAVLAWTVREGTTNVIRHNGARSCRIEVRPGPLAATAEVVDDGHGAEHVSRGSGLAGLQERAERLAGRVEAGPGTRGGFRLMVTVPVRGGAP